MANYLAFFAQFQLYTVPCTTSSLFDAWDVARNLALRTLYLEILQVSWQGTRKGTTEIAPRETQAL